MLPQPAQRYVAKHTGANQTSWRFNNKTRKMPAGHLLRIEVLAPARIHWTLDNWKTAEDSETVATGLGVYFADLPTQEVGVNGEIRFTMFWPQANHWEGTDFLVHVIATTV